LNMAVQLVKAGEAVYSHRHTNAAMRFVIEGGEGVYTITDGENAIWSGAIL
jgi:gentisate 1,2-dioxygenase